MTNNQLEILLTLRDKATAQLKKFQSFTKKSIAFMRKHWIALGVAIVAVTRALKFIVDEAIRFESAFAGVRKTVDATEKEFAQLSKGLIDMSRRIPVAASELAGIQEIAGQLGIRGVKNLTKFTEAIAKIAVTTNLTKEAAATSFARISAVIGEPIENIENMASAVVSLGNQFPVTESEIVTFSQRIAGMGKVAGLTTDEIFGISAAFASVGIQAELGGTAINRVLLKLTAEGKTGAEEFVKFVNTLVKGSDDVAGTLNKLGLTSARSQQAFLNLAGAGGQLEKALAIANKGFIEGNALNEEAAKRFETTASKIELIKNNISALSIEIGNKLLPVFEKLLTVTKQYVDYVTGADLVMNNLQLLESSLERINGIIEERNNSLANFNPLINSQYKEQTQRLIRQRAALVGLINKEKERVDIFSKAESEIITMLKKEKDTHKKINEDKAAADAAYLKEVQDLWDKNTKTHMAGLLALGSATASVMGELAIMTGQIWLSQAKIVIETIVSVMKVIIAAVNATLGPLGWLKAALEVTAIVLAAANAFSQIESQQKALDAIKTQVATPVTSVPATSVPALAEGGIVTRPTLALIGEAGPEAVIPLGKGGSLETGDINIFIQGGISPEGNSIDEMAEQLGFAFESRIRTARGI